MDFLNARLHGVEIADIEFVDRNAVLVGERLSALIVAAIIRGNVKTRLLELDRDRLANASWFRRSPMRLRAIIPSLHATDMSSAEFCPDSAIIPSRNLTRHLE